MPVNNYLEQQLQRNNNVIMVSASLFCTFELPGRRLTTQIKKSVKTVCLQKYSIMLSLLFFEAQNDTSPEKRASMLRAIYLISNRNSCSFYHSVKDDLGGLMEALW